MGNPGEQTQDQGRSGLQGASPRLSLSGTRGKGLFVLLAGLLFLALFAGCAKPRTSFETEGFTASRNYSSVSLRPRTGTTFTVWNMQEVPADVVADMVLTEIRAKGYAQEPSDEADLWVSVHAFKGESSSQSGSEEVVVEFQERVWGNRVWFGTIHIPTPSEAADPKGISVSPEDVKELLKRLPDPISTQTRTLSARRVVLPL